MMVNININSLKMASSRGQNYKNSEVKTRINERLDNVVIDSGKLAQSITKSSRSREVNE